MEQTLNTFVVSASVTNASSPIKGLDEGVKIVLQHLAPNTVGPTALKKTANRCFTPDNTSMGHCCL